ncbi:Hypothetical predicted protein, partial [Mytilus galloprovincialis]
HASLIGVNTGKVVKFDVRTRNCSICQYHIGKNEPKPPHECNVNWTGLAATERHIYVFYGGTKSLKARVSSAVMQKNEGYGWLSKVNKKSLLSPGHLTILHGIRKDRRRKQIRKTQSTTNFKRKRLTIKSKKLKDNQRESVKEGDTYGGEIEVQEHIDTETIPSKMKFEGEESVVVFDLETTALLTDSYIPLIRASRITKLTARQLAHSGLCLKHLQLAFNRDSENGLKSILLEHGFNAKTVTSFTKYFTCTEE